MTKIGGYLIAFAVISIILQQFNYELTIMSWIDNLGVGSWLLRGGMIVAGVALIVSDQK